MIFPELRNLYVLVGFEEVRDSSGRTFPRSYIPVDSKGGKSVFAPVISETDGSGKIIHVMQGEVAGRRDEDFLVVPIGVVGRIAHAYRKNRRGLPAAMRRFNPYDCDRINLSYPRRRQQEAKR